MTGAQIWVTLFGLALVTLVTRAGFLLLPRSLQLPPAAQRALRYAPACALVAIVAPDLLLTHGGPQPGMLDLSVHNLRLVAAAGAAAVFAWSKNMLLTIAAGMLLYTALRLSGG